MTGDLRSKEKLIVNKLPNQEHYEAFYECYQVVVSCNAPTMKEAIVKVLGKWLNLYHKQFK